jgi:glutamine amidotransferase
MARLRNAGLVETIRELRQPLLGVCVGMQLLYESSEEGDVDCLGLFPGRVQRLQPDLGLPIPHMGWNQLEFEKSSPLLQDISPGDYVYFVHSYCVPVSDATLAKCTYGKAFSAIVQRGNVYGAQFHPERSASIGSQLLRNFLSV